ncbi:hypothetical protein GCM10011321_14150 [Youhaiella tibetensis]|uniref:Uncharacterized protein n=1 Tax=Paradevosia tibetensis TaxID=1447062 RepID=A0A5B9DPJ2_9HYPH|nr:hypothetical protein [Youhaiella tibetensis]AKR55322.1 hypothetical protein XM25_05770 [Devosia sp. H5989]QEE20458.1 hypothetical protein FNA67_09875 [Youhaiella tibetensis]GGF23994.1 hypothetical protein GCM10011321_14150 [Youhaiella tibetensis]
MPVFEVNIAIPGQPVQPVIVQDERDLERFSVALVENGFVATQEVRVIWTGVEYEGRHSEYSAVEPVGAISIVAGSVLFIRRLELPA